MITLYKKGKKNILSVTLELQGDKVIQTKKSNNSDKEYVSIKDTDINKLKLTYMKDGYVELNDGENPNNVRIKPMLLNPIKEKDISKIEYPICVQKKFDGIKCIAFKDENDVITLYSREGNAFNIPHILESVKKIFSDFNINKLDGELYNHSLILHDINGKVKTGDKNKELDFVIYDIPIEDYDFKTRMNILTSISFEEYNHIKFETGIVVNNYDELKEVHRHNLEMMYEGSVLCKLDSKYHSGFRTSDKLKLKPRETDEFLCVGHYMNTGRMEKQSTLICKTKDGKNEFHVKMKGTDAQREQYAIDFETKFKNKMITVEYRKLAKSGKPIEAVGITVRDYE